MVNHADGSDLPVESLDPRDRVIRAAETLFGQRGYNTVKMQEIAAAVGIRQASLYHHFPSKEQLFVVVLEQMLTRHQQGLQHAIAAAGSDLRAQLQAVAGWFCSQPPLHLLSMMHTEVAALSHEARERLSTMTRVTLFEPLVDLFTQAQMRQQIRAVDAGIVAGFLLSMMDGIDLAQTFPESLSRQTMAELMISVLLEGLQRPATSELDGAAP